MKVKIFRISGIILGLIFLGIVSLLAYIKFALPNTGPAPEMKIERTPERISRGKYLAHHVMVCMDCHAQRDWQLFAAPPVEGTLGQGGEVFDQKMGFPGRYVAPNITPYALKDWTDGEIFRTITTGVSKDGRALFNIMPYHNYGKLDEEDIKSVIAYIRTLDPIENVVAKSSSDFPMNFIVNLIPRVAEFQSIPPKENGKEYGKYLVTAASCYDCHTNQVQGEFIGEDFAGGMVFELPSGTIQSPNITPHSTGLGNWSEKQFVYRFKMYADSAYAKIALGPKDPQTVMPWTMYAGMEETDIKAIYHYLQSIPPIDNGISAYSNAQK